MIIVYSSKNLHEALKRHPKLKRVIDNSLKAKRQPRLANGRFAKPTPTVKTVAKNPLVQFFYPMSNHPGNAMLRTVRLISSTGTHYTGMEKTNKGWKYKKFLVPKATQFKVLEFNPQSMS